MQIVSESERIKSRTGKWRSWKWLWRPFSNRVGFVCAQL